jgi:hypothetical protein
MDDHKSSSRSLMCAGLRDKTHWRWRHMDTWVRTVVRFSCWPAAHMCQEHRTKVVLSASEDVGVVSFPSSVLSLPDPYTASLNSIVSFCFIDKETKMQNAKVPSPWLPGEQGQSSVSLSVCLLYLLVESQASFPRLSNSPVLQIRPSPKFSSKNLVSFKWILTQLSVLEFYWLFNVPAAIIHFLLCFCDVYMR